MAFAGADRGSLWMALAVGAALVCALPAAAAPAPSPPLELEKAGWTLITGTEDTFVFMKAAGRPGADGVRRVWTAYDSTLVRDRQGFAFRSVESLAEFDCRKKLSRIVEERFHDLPALKGQTWKQPDFTPTPWAAPAPGSIGAVRFAWACQSLSDT